MKCFVHRDVDAIAICKCCAKGVCAVCSVPLEQGVACSKECETHANETTELVRAGVAARKLNTKAGGGYFHPVFLVVMGIAFWLLPIFYGKPFLLSGFPFVFGSLMATFGIVLAVYHAVWQSKVRRGV